MSGQAMTPDTTPAPMTHEAKPWCPCKNHARFTEGCALCQTANGQRWIDHRMAVDGFNEAMVRGSEVRQLRERAERAERDRNEWRRIAQLGGRTIEAGAKAIEEAEARIAELEAGIGRLADEFTHEARRSEDWGYDEAASAIEECATELRSLLRITHEEGRK